MKHYVLKLLTQLYGPQTFIYSSDTDLDDFIESIKEECGTFIQLSVDEFNDSENLIIDQVIKLEPGEEIEIKPFMTTYTVYKNPYPPYDKLEIDTTSDGWKKGECTIHEFMLAIRSGTFLNINFK